MTAITCESYSNILINTTLNRVPNDSEKFASISVKRVYKYDSRNFYWMLSTREYQSMRYRQKDGVFYIGFINPVLLAPYHLQRRAPERIQKKNMQQKTRSGHRKLFRVNFSLNLSFTQTCRHAPKLFLWLPMTNFNPELFCQDI